MYLLLVDDEPSILSALKRELRGWARERAVEIVAANSASEALAFLEDQHLDVAVIMSDQKMPGIKGHELLAEVAQRYPEIIQLMLTGYTDINDIVKTIRAGVYSFILKPWDRDDLLYEITRAYNTFQLHRNNERYLKRLKEESLLSGAIHADLARMASLSVPGVAVESCFVAARAGVTTTRSLHLSRPTREGGTTVVAMSIQSDETHATLIAAALAAHVGHATESGEPLQVARALHGTLRAPLRVVPECIVSAGIASISADRRTLRFVGAGGVAAILIRGTQFADLEARADSLDSASPPSEGQQVVVDLDIGDRIALFSSGVIEAVDGERPDRQLARQLHDAIEADGLAGGVASVCASLPEAEHADHAITVVDVSAES